MNDKIAKYKIDDKVKMGPKVWQEEQIKKSLDPYYEPIAPDKIVTIVSNKSDGIYELKFGELVYECQILGYAFEYGDKIEVSEDGVHWLRATFSTYDPSSNSGKVVTTDNSYHSARPIQAPTLSDFSLADMGREIIRREEG